MAKQHIKLVLQPNCVRRDSGAVRDILGLYVIRGITVRMISHNVEYDSNGDHYHGWPCMLLPAWTGGGEDDLSGCIRANDTGAEITLPVLSQLATSDEHEAAIQEIVDADPRVPGLLDRIAAGHDSYWDEHDHSGTITEDALRAAAELITLIDEAIAAAPCDGREATEWSWLEYERNDDGSRTIVESGVNDGWTCLYWQDCGGVHENLLGADSRDALIAALDASGIPHVDEEDDDSEMVSVHIRTEHLDRASDLMAEQEDD